MPAPAVIPLAVLVLSAPAAAQTALTVRQAERHIQRAQDRTADFYLNAHPAGVPFYTMVRTDSGSYRTVRTSSPTLPPPDCIALDDDSCFFGDRECIECIWDAKAMPELAAFYEEAAARIGTPPVGVRADLLDWLAGQRVGVWTRLRDYERARTAARECHARLWWCEALSAHVEHQAGNYLGAEQVFRRVLQLMEEGRACFWNELHVFRDPSTGGRGSTPTIGFDAFSRYRRSPQPDRARPCPDHAETEQFWTLADPLFTIPGNDRMTEHYTRLVELHIHALFRSAVIMYPDNERNYHFSGHHSAVVRLGWPVGRRALGGATKPVFDPRGQSFIVLADAADALTADAGQFLIRDRASPDSYRAPYGRVESLPLQTGFFRRYGEPVLLVRAQPPPADRPVPFAWSMRSWDGADWRDAEVHPADDALTAWLSTPWLPQVVSLEGVHGSGAYRARTGNRPPPSTTSPAVSSLIIMDARAEHGSLAQAALAMLPRTALTRADTVATFVEIYTDSPRNAAVELTITPIQTGILNRLGLRRQPERRLSWTEGLDPLNGVVSRALALDVDALAAGEYDIVLTLTLDTAEILMTSTRISVLDR